MDYKKREWQACEVSYKWKSVMTKKFSQCRKLANNIHRNKKRVYLFKELEYGSRPVARKKET